MTTLPLGTYTELSKHDLLVRFTPNKPSLDEGLAYDYMLSHLLLDEYKQELIYKFKPLKWKKTYNGLTAFTPFGFDYLITDETGCGLNGNHMMYLSRFTTTKLFIELDNSELEQIGKFNKRTINPDCTINQAKIAAQEHYNQYLKETQ